MVETRRSLWDTKMTRLLAAHPSRPFDKHCYMKQSMSTLHISYIDLSTNGYITIMSNGSRVKAPAVALERLLGEDGPWEIKIGRNAPPPIGSPGRKNDAAIQADSVGRQHALLKITRDADGVSYRTTLELEKKAEVPLGVRRDAGASIELRYEGHDTGAWGTVKIKLGKAILAIKLTPPRRPSTGSRYR